MLHRLLIGPLSSARTPPRDLGPRRTFGTSEGDLLLGPADSWEAVCQRLPMDWRADGVVLSLQGGGAAPIGLWSASVPLIALAPDLRSRWHWARHVLGRCDLVITDADSADHPQQFGIGRLHVPSGWENDPVSAEATASDRFWTELLDVVERAWSALAEHARERRA
jgi:hypothetical protein